MMVFPNDSKTEPPKPIWESKTAAFNGLVALSMLVPSVAAWVSAHVLLVTLFITGANVVLRIATKGRVIVYPEALRKMVAYIKPK